MREDTVAGPTPKEVKHVLQEAVLRNYPNPERRGCLNSSTLRAIAHEKVPPEDSRWEHISHCSPCYREFLSVRKDVRETLIRRVRTKWVMVAAAVMLVVGLSIWSVRDRFRQNQSIGITTQDAEPRLLSESKRPVLTAVLNFETESVTRSATNNTAAVSELQEVPRGRLALSINLPVGSEPGEYTIRLQKDPADATALSEFTSAGHLENGLTVLIVSADLSTLERGIYVLGIRREEGSWRYYRFAVS